MKLAADVVTVKWGVRNKKRFVNLGYKFTRMGEELGVKISDLPTSSRVLVPVFCDTCHKVGNMPFNLYKEENAYNCIKCYSVNKRRPFEEVKVAFEEAGYTLLSSSSEYTNAHHKLLCYCNRHPDVLKYAAPAAVLRGKRCSICRAEDRKLSFAEVLSAFEAKNYTLISTEYVNNNSYLLYRCNLHPELTQKIWYANLRSGKGCVICANLRMVGPNHPNWKGGHSNLVKYLRGYLSEWKRQSAISCDHKCIISGATKNIIHHLYPFHKIMHESLQHLGVTSAEGGSYPAHVLDELAKSIIMAHWKHPLGVCLSYALHAEFHNTYGKTRFSEEDFIKFYHQKTGSIFVPKYATEGGEVSARVGVVRGERNSIYTYRR